MVSMQGICKTFGTVVANDHVCLEVKCGEVHALLGENGAGKTTLMKVLSGDYQPDQGEIRVEGRLVTFGSPRDASRAGIGMVHQHFRLVDVFTVAQNMVIGLDRPGLRLDLRKVEEEVSELGSRYRLKVDPRGFVWQLSVGERQRVEILRVLMRGARILVLDEPTAVLTPQEAQELQEILRDLALGGSSVILITHKMKEVMEVADRITVLRQGKNVATVRKKDADARQLAQLMVGKEVPSVAQDRAKPGQAQLSVRQLNVLSDTGSPIVRDLSLEIRQGEIVGLAGVSGNGQRELAECIYGLRPSVSGEVRVSGHPITNLKPAQVIGSGLRLIPEDRLGTGLIPAMSVQENLILTAYLDPSLGNRVALDAHAIREYCWRLINAFSVNVVDLNAPVWKLSGGNLQRLMLAREVSATPKVLVAVHPTRGLDLQSAAWIHQLLIDQRNGGAAILLISEDLDEILALSDRVAVIYAGQLLGEVDRKDATIGEIALLMAGSHLQERPR